MFCFEEQNKRNSALNDMYSCCSQNSDFWMEAHLRIMILWQVRNYKLLPIKIIFKVIFVLIKKLASESKEKLIVQLYLSFFQKVLYINQSFAQLIDNVSYIVNCAQVNIIH